MYRGFNDNFETTGGRDRDEGYYMSKHVRRVDEETERFNRIIHIIKSICDMAGFSVENRIVLKDNNTGRIWR